MIFLKRFLVVILISVVVCAAVYFVKDGVNFREVTIFDGISGETKISTTHGAVTENNGGESGKMYCLWLTYSEIGELVGENGGGVQTRSLGGFRQS